jgi:hypothetical protein
MPSKVKLKVKGCAAVDPDSKLDDIAHVCERKGEIYNAVLGITDIQSGKNSYYKLQVLESDAGNRYRSTGFLLANKVVSTLIQIEPSCTTAMSSWLTCYLNLLSTLPPRNFSSSPL